MSQVYSIKVTIPAKMTVDGFDAMRTFTVSKTLSYEFFNILNMKGYKWEATLIVTHDEMVSLKSSLSKFEELSNIINSEISV